MASQRVVDAASLRRRFKCERDAIRFADHRRPVRSQYAAKIFTGTPPSRNAPTVGEQPAVAAPMTGHERARPAAVRKPAFWVLASMPASLGHPGQRSVLDDRQLPTELTRHCVPTQQPSTRRPWLGKANDRQITGRLSRVTDAVVEEVADC